MKLGVEEYDSRQRHHLSRAEPLHQDCPLNWKKSLLSNVMSFLRRVLWCMRLVYKGIKSTYARLVGRRKIVNNSQKPQVQRPKRIHTLLLLRRRQGGKNIWSKIFSDLCTRRRRRKRPPGLATLPITHWHGLAAVQLARLHSRKGKKAKPPKKEGGTWDTGQFRLVSYWTTSCEL